jgi:hypothetical protein
VKHGDARLKARQVASTTVGEADEFEWSRVWGEGWMRKEEGTRERDERGRMQFKRVK